MHELIDADKEEINAFAAVVVAKVLDEVTPNSEVLKTSQLALGSLACKWAGKHHEMHALNPVTERPDKL